jgi:hypothetical protein
MILDSQGIGGVWAWSIGFWSALLVWPLSTVFFVVASFFSTRQGRPLMLIGGPICFGPMFAVASFFLFAVVGFVIGFVYGQRFTDR